MKSLLSTLIMVFLVNISFGQKKDNSAPQMASTAVSEPIFVKTEIPPAFPGGEMDLKNYISRQFQSLLQNKELPSGKYLVEVGFIVDKQGNIYDKKPISKTGYELEEYLLDIIQLGPKWKPAIQNGHIVQCFVKQSYQFTID